MPQPAPLSTGILRRDSSDALTRLRQASMAESTRRNYLSQLQRLQAHLGSNQLTDRTLAEYLSQMFELGRSAALASLVVAAVRCWCRMCAIESPIGPMTDQVLRGFRRQGHGRGRGQAIGVRWIAADHASTVAIAEGTLRGLRDAALLRVMSDALLRISEVSRLQTSDIVYAEDGSARVTIRGDKTSQDGRDRSMFLGQPTARLVQQWVLEAQIKDGPLFRRLRKGGQVLAQGISPASVREIVRSRCRAVGIEGATGHSLRVGAAQSLAKEGASLVEMQVAGRWSSPAMPAHYARHEMAASGAVARLRYTAKEDCVQPHARSKTSMHTFEQQSRRYLGNKYKLTSFIREIVANKCPDYRSVADVFAGTGVVGAAFNAPNVRIIANDLLRSNYVCLDAFLGIQIDRRVRIAELVDHLNRLSPEKTNYFSRHFGGRYFSQENARKIGTVRAEIDRIAVDETEKNILLCSLVYAVDKVANTVGHYDAYRKRMDMLQRLQLRVPASDIDSNDHNEIHCEDANRLIRRIDCDVLYIDPPYNSRQYSDAYHLLENLVVWNKPAVKGMARKMDRTRIKSRYCINGAADAFADLVRHASCRHILLSYNNTGGSMDGRSNARIADDEIMDILTAKGDVEIFSKQHKAFTTGKNVAEANAERVFHCRVREGA